MSPPRTKSRGRLSQTDLLRDLIYRRSFQLSPRAEFKLASGRMSRVYLDCKKVTLHPEGASLIGQLLFARIKHRRPDAVGGLTLGADPIALAIAVASFQRGQPIPAFIVRKEPKGHGSQVWIEGDLSIGARVVVVEDVVTTGGSTMKAIERVKAHGCEILGVLALVDRLEGGRERLASAGYRLDSLFTIKDFLALTGIPPESPELP